MLKDHLDQIAVSAASIGELEFPPCQPFTNALLNNQEITALIRDTEPHERGLFTIDPNIRSSISQVNSRPYGNEANGRRKTVYGNAQLHSSAVARVLGSDLLKKIQASNRESGRGRRVDIEVLLQGAEKLCAAFDVPGAADRVALLRAKHDQISISIQRYEEKLSSQQSSLNSFGDSRQGDDADIPSNDTVSFGLNPPQAFSEEDVRAEEEAVKELEAKKKSLEARVAGIERDLGGLRD